MKLVRSAILYTALALGANAAAAEGMSEKLAAAVSDGGELRALAIHDTPRPLPEAALEGPDGATSLAEYNGRIVVLNFWAVWCAPCREEMPTLSALEAEFGGDDFAVVTLATGPNAPPAVARFFDEIGVDNLPLLRDPKAELSRAAGVFGLPATLILDRDGAEIARLVGPADWHSEAARAAVTALLQD